MVYTKQTPEEINTMLRQYEQLSALRLWLVKRVERGLPIPDSMEETTELVRLDPTGFPAKKFRYDHLNQAYFAILLIDLISRACCWSQSQAPILKRH